MLEEAYKALVNNLSLGEGCVMLTYLDLHNKTGGTISSKIILANEEVKNKLIPLTEQINKEIELCLSTGRIRIVNLEDEKALLIEPFAPKPRLIVFGGGHISKPLSEFAARVGFSVTIVDDRPSFANAQRFPEADKVICESFEKAFDKINLKSSDYVVAITRGHKYDGVILRKVLKHELRYVGMIGSKRRAKGMLEELLEEGYSKEKLNQVHSPIGLDIGAVTPDEIAVSIVAQLISYKNMSSAYSSADKSIQPEFDIEVAEKIIEATEVPKALITVLSSKGSVPRKASAKMIAYMDGRTVGSIGGGCSEAEVIRKARGLMLDKGFLIEHVDMTNDVAESEGMVCGGVMEVLVEVF